MGIKFNKQNHTLILVPFCLKISSPSETLHFTLIVSSSILWFPTGPSVLLFVMLNDVLRSCTCNYKNARILFHLFLNTMHMDILNAVNFF